MSEKKPVRRKLAAAILLALIGLPIDDNRPIHHDATEAITVPGQRIKGWFVPTRAEEPSPLFDTTELRDGDTNDRAQDSRQFTMEAPLPPTPQPIFDDVPIQMTARFGVIFRAPWIWQFEPEYVTSTTIIDKLGQPLQVYNADAGRVIAWDIPRYLAEAGKRAEARRAAGLA